ncbi:MAG: hypothetical protein ABIY40_03160 [Rhodanobacteraceae bacterium]|nr:hypothetical protein [Pseudomonadota bacterium]
MRNFALVVVIALVATFALSACNKNQPAEQAAQTVQVSKPTSPTDMKGWQAYLSQIVQQHMQGIQNNPYVYFVPPGDNPDQQAERGRVQDLLNGVVAATVLPGNMIVAGGPDSGKTADALIAAFKNAQPGSFKDVVVMFIGDAADKQRTQAAIAPSGAEFRFAQI